MAYFYVFKDKNHRNDDDYRHQMAIIKGHLVRYDAYSDTKFNDYELENFSYIGMGERVYGPQDESIHILDIKPERRLARMLTDIMNYDRFNIRVAETLQNYKNAGHIRDYRIMKNYSEVTVKRNDGQMIFMDWPRHINTIF